MDAGEDKNEPESGRRLPENVLYGNAEKNEINWAPDGGEGVKGHDYEGGEKKARWSKKQLIETEGQKMARWAKQSSLLGTAFFLMAMQIFASVVLLLSGLSVSEETETDWQLLPLSIPVVATRFTCGIVLHIYLESELVQGFSSMKYALNHPWKFERARLAFFAGFAQAIVVFVIEGVNYILMLTQDQPIDIVLNFLALVFISQFDDFFYQTYADQEFKKVIRDLSGKYENFLQIQTTTSFKARHKVLANRIKKQHVEMISPLSEDVQNEIPLYMKLEWQHRGRWRGNRCLWVLYRIMRKLLVCFWFYFIPFAALGLSFILPYEAARKVPPPSTMDSSYVAWLEQAENNGVVEDGYIEPSVDEIVAMMESIPLQDESWGVYTDILVLPLTLDQYWDAFWADEAPYYYPGIERDPEDIFLSSSTWGEPSEEF